VVADYNLYTDDYQLFKHLWF